MLFTHVEMLVKTLDWRPTMTVEMQEQEEDIYFTDDDRDRETKKKKKHVKGGADVSTETIPRRR